MDNFENGLSGPKKDYYDPDFHGTDQYDRYPIGGVLYTDSVGFFWEKYKAWWTLDVVGSYYDRTTGGPDRQPRDRVHRPDRLDQAVL